MRLVASMMVGPGEGDRYLRPALEHLTSFCDEVRIRQEGDDTTAAIGRPGRWPVPVEVVTVHHESPSTFYNHEGRARQQLLDFTLEANPTHVLAIDADEFVTDGQAVRRACEKGTAPGAWHLCMQEVWQATESSLMLRQDGGWGEHDVPILWAPERLRGPLTLPDRALACGRTPTALDGIPREHTCSAVLHFGWTNQAERAARYQRYVEHDGGRFHARAHLDSIMFPDDRVSLLERDWPPGLAPWKDAILAHAGVAG